MFFEDEEENKNLHESQALEYKGSFTSSNMDVN